MWTVYFLASLMYMNGCYEFAGRLIHDEDTAWLWALGAFVWATIMIDQHAHLKEGYEQRRRTC